MKPIPLTAEEIARTLALLPGWQHEGDALITRFVFEDFRAALAWMMRAGFEAEALNHHPEWTNIYRTVKVRLCTHDVGDRVTALDAELAARLQTLAHAAGAQAG